MFDAGEFDVATLFYAEFKSVITQIPTARQLIPAEITGEGKEAGGGAVYEHEPDEESILAELLPRNVSVQIFRALLENAASEMGAKMTAMDNATRNAGDMIDALTLELQPHAPGADHQGTDRNHLRRRGAVDRRQRKASWPRPARRRQTSRA